MHDVRTPVAHRVLSPHPHVAYLPFLRRPSTATGEWTETHVPVRVIPAFAGGNHARLSSSAPIPAQAPTWGMSLDR